MGSNDQKRRGWLKKKLIGIILILVSIVIVASTLSMQALPSAKLRIIGLLNNPAIQKMDDELKRHAISH